MVAAKIDKCPKREKCVVILMDEMHIKENIVYDKHGTISVAAFWLFLCQF